MHHQHGTMASYTIDTRVLAKCALKSYRISWCMRIDLASGGLFDKTVWCAALWPEWGCQAKHPGANSSRAPQDDAPTEHSCSNARPIYPPQCTSIWVRLAIQGRMPPCHIHQSLWASPWQSTLQHMVNGFISPWDGQASNGIAEPEVPLGMRLSWSLV